MTITQDGTTLPPTLVARVHAIMPNFSVSELLALFEDEGYCLVPMDERNRILGERDAAVLNVQLAHDNGVEQRRLLDIAQHDLQVVCDHIYEEAINRDWCGEYDDFVQNVNDACRGNPMHVRSNSLTFTITVSVDVPVTVDHDELRTAAEDAVNGSLDDFQPTDRTVEITAG